MQDDRQNARPARAYRTAVAALKQAFEQPGSGFDAMIVLIVSSQHRSPKNLVPGAPPVSSQRCTRRQRTTHQPSTGPSSTPVTASPQSPGAFSPQQCLAKPSRCNAAAEPNPHRRPTAQRLPAGSFFGGFRTPALSLRVHRSRQAGIRNPTRYQTLPA